MWRYQFWSLTNGKLVRMGFENKFQTAKNELGIRLR